jgi:hypothetical protein
MGSSTSGAAAGGASTGSTGEGATEGALADGASTGGALTGGALTGGLSRVKTLPLTLFMVATLAEPAFSIVLASSLLLEHVPVECPSTLQCLQNFGKVS